jgi:hypothetical protein
LDLVGSQRLLADLTVGFAARVLALLRGGVARLDGVLADRRVALAGT